MALLHYTDGAWFPDFDIRPIAFFGYESHVLGAVVETCFKSGDSLDQLREHLVKVFVDAKIKAHLDNKIVFVVEHKTQLWCLGFYDGHFTLGTSVRKTF